MQKNSNKIETFPLDIRGAIDDMLLNNVPIIQVVANMKTDYKITLDRETVSKYKRKLFEETKQQQMPYNSEIVEQEEIKNVQLVSNKKDLLESLIADSYQRLQDIRRMNKRRFDPKWEGYITSYTDNIRKIIETLSKLSEEFDDTTRIDNIVKRHLSKLLRCVYETVKVVCPEKSIQFKDVLSEKYQSIAKELK